MTIDQYWTILIKRWPILLICLLVVGLGTLIGSKLMKPVYQSSTIIEVVVSSITSNQSVYTDLQASDQLVQTEADLAIGNSVLDEIAPHYPGLTAAQLAGEVSATAKLSTQLFEIDVVDESPVRAEELANAIAAALIKQQQQITQQENAQGQQQIEQNLRQTSQQIADTTTHISSLQAGRGNQSQIALLQTQLNGLEQRSNQWQTALAQLELTQAQDGNILQVVQPAQLASTPLRPDILVYTGIGLLVGFLLGTVLALLYERLDPRIRTPEEISDILSWPVLAAIWCVHSQKPHDLINLTCQNINVEPFRMLRTSIGFASLNRSFYSLAVTSVQQNDGKSVIVANLAIFMARAGKRVLLVDGDLRRPLQQTFFNLPPDTLGFSDAVLNLSMLDASQNSASHPLVGSASTFSSLNDLETTPFSLETFLHTVGIPNLWVMPSGPLPSNPPEFLESKAMRRFLTAIANCGVEVVIFDMSPLLGLSDASILASKVDGTLLVVDTTRVTKERLRKVKTIISQTGVCMIGCVANKLPHKRSDNAYAEKIKQARKTVRNGY
jgi:capsular polysaccharide biosynthesis protein/Mrp family chromosome partitioning ATPase